ncbi:MAG: secondary thiamine-phosphate synthase enzyme YjbQ [Methanocalculus sp.]|uniref:secondary thiamine-phosphate synthase enzyme YjbQ n=1 Tax=Methanocalculus sp. TaxID=2004547 RepID=UPI0027270A86|nr:secondary thiamine-phosphate synthase enzyme YjbQ [Methanocalculus sp.]MDO8841247.1 secondary thiamine-phosphate synthase enzyme YjbQ [Methanocalculus sp.]MDO9539503.1 secondary thiamine-phosphate synthase enzyme YjbQ [Methanocalculus sp.]
MYQTTLHLKTSGEGDVIDITPFVSEAVLKSGIVTGLVHLFVPGSTAALTTIEYEPGAVADLGDALSRIAPEEAAYAHDKRWGDGNGRSHVRAALIGPSITIPVAEKRLILGRWQQVILCELDIRSTRERSVILTIAP